MNIFSLRKDRERGVSTARERNEPWYRERAEYGRETSVSAGEISEKIEIL